MGDCFKFCGLFRKPERFSWILDEGIANKRPICGKCWFSSVTTFQNDVLNMPFNHFRYLVTYILNIFLNIHIEPPTTLTHFCRDTC